MVYRKAHTELGFATFFCSVFFIGGIISCITEGNTIMIPIVSLLLICFCIMKYQADEKEYLEKKENYEFKKAVASERRAKRYAKEQANVEELWKMNEKFKEELARIKKIA